MSKDHIFKIKIDDGDCAYMYELKIPGGSDLSIRDIYIAICEKFNVEPKGGVYQHE